LAAGYHPPDTSNVSLPDISSTDIAPNKLTIPSKILNINHVRGLQFYQKQLSKGNVSVPRQGAEMLGSSDGSAAVLEGQRMMMAVNGGGNKISVKNNI
jgi:hypothetical protein